MLWRVIGLCIVTLLSVGDASTQERAPRNAIDRAQALLRTEDFANAKRALEKLEKDEARLRGKDNVDYARILAMLGRAQAETNQAAPAVANIGHALDILRSRRAPDAEISSAEHALARAFLNQQRSTEARPLLERIVERSNANKSAVSRLTAADALRDLGHIAVAEEDWQRGVSLLSRALQLLEREFGGDDARVIPVLNDLGIAEGKLGKPALPRFEKARSIAMSKKLFGAEAVALERMTELLEQTDGATARTTLESACKLLSIYFTLTYEHLNLRRWEDARPALKNLVGLA